MNRTQTAPPAYSSVELPPPSYNVEDARKCITNLTSGQCEALEHGVVKALSSSAVEPALLQAARDAAAANDRIEDMFVSLTRRLVGIDSGSQDVPPFSPEFYAIRDDYRALIMDSKDLAMKIAVMAEHFDGVTAPACGDDMVTLAQKHEQIDYYLNEADSIADMAKAMITRSKTLKDRFSKLVERFSTWAEKQEDRISGEIETLKRDIRILEEKIAKLSVAVDTLGAVLGATIGIAGVAAALGPAAIPTILALAAVFAGIELGALIGVLVARQKAESDLGNKKDALIDKQAELDRVRAAETELQAAGQDALKTFGDNINLFVLVWRNTQTDALQIREWLKEGADPNAKPAYLAAVMYNAVNCYASMAKYLRQYAYGLSGTA